MFAEEIKHTGLMILSHTELSSFNNESTLDTNEPGDTDLTGETQASLSSLYE